MASINLQEKANFTRLSRLLVDKGNEALRNTLDTIHYPANLPAVLNANRTSLLKLKPRLINDIQWDLLFPPSGNPPDSKTFDVTLITVLLRNICGLLPPATGWNTMPPVADRSQEANITRIRLLRNQIYAHVSSTQVHNATFENFWKNISQVLVDLKIPQTEIDDLKTGSLAPTEETYLQSIKEWRLKEKDYRKILDNIEKAFKSIQRQQLQILTRSMQQVTENISEEIHQEKKQLCPSRSRQSESEHKEWDCEGSKFGEKHNNSVEDLAKHNFSSKIQGKVKLFYPGTRKWLLQKVESWFTDKDESSLMLITAGPGFGKSVFAAKVCEIFRKKKKLAAFYFCDLSISSLKDPMMMLRSLASHMCENVPGFKEKLLDQLKLPHKVNHLKDAFQIYLQNPLKELELEPRLIVIDGLDQIGSDRSDMVKLIADHFAELPKCVKVLVTSRPEISIAKLGCGKRIRIDASDEDNNLDLLKYLTVCLPNIAARDAANHSAVLVHSGTSYCKLLPAIVARCEGSFLYAFHVQHELCKPEDLDRMTFEGIMSFLPRGIVDTLIMLIR